MKDALIHQFVGLQLRLDYNMALNAFTTHLNISHIYELIFTKFIANHKNVLKGQVPRINSIKLTKKKNGEGGGIHLLRPWYVRGSNPQTGTFIISHKRGTICLFVSCFALLRYVWFFHFCVSYEKVIGIR